MDSEESFDHLEDNDSDSDYGASLQHTPKKNSTPRKRKTPLAETPESAKAKKAKKASKPKDTPSSPPLALSLSPAPASASTSNSKTKVKKVEEIYQKKTQVEHILLRPDTYIGSVEPEKTSLWVYDNATGSMQYKPVTIVPGLYKIFDEILVNAADNKIRDSTMTSIKVTIDRTNNIISIYNNGKGIPVEIHQKEQVYVPELIFGHLLTSSNYDDSEKKVTGGRNGYGAKLANIFSTEFIVETSDKASGHKFKQVFTDNMSKTGKPQITKATKEDFTKITFKPDLLKFNMTEIDDDLESLLKKRVYDLAGCVSGVNVFLNDERIKCKGFKQYAEMYMGGTLQTVSPRKRQKKVIGDSQDNTQDNPVKLDMDGDLVMNEVYVDGDEKDEKDRKDEKDENDEKDDKQEILEDKENEEKGDEKDKELTNSQVMKPSIIYERVNERWEVAFAVSHGQFQQVSFVNSICTSKGGTHVQYIADQIANKILEVLKKKNKGATLIKNFQVKSHLWIFVNCLIENPTFDSQTKENMTLAVSKFGSKAVLSEIFTNKVLRTSVLDNILSLARSKQDQLLKKTDGKKRSRVRIAKLDDANNAGTRNASKCTLILTEGDSAKSLAVAGLSVIGRDNFGVFPLRGKLLNVRDASGKQVQENAEINQIKQILGLQHGKQYDSTESLRYGHLMIMTDQDHDGSHIKGLLVNLIDHFWPSLLRCNDFLLEFVTPIVRAKRGRSTKDFYTIPEYEAWRATTNPDENWKIKYYKGLGTSTPEDAKKYFGDLDTHVKLFKAATDEDRELIDLAFSKKRANNRKDWLGNFQLGTYMDHKTKEIPISDFVNKELILFSMADNIRSIPSVMDGLKPGQRKILYGCFKRKLKDEIKVAQLAGYVSEHTSYHHGEQSLHQTIVGLAQDFVGSNNVNLLEPIGQFGTRLQGGKDAASARYIFTNLSPLARKIFHKDDDNVLTYLNDDGLAIEPEWFCPIIPMVLVNGSDGIGTGWSSFIPNYNPEDIVKNIRRLLRREEIEPMHPWYRGFTGTIEKMDGDKYKVTGEINKINDTTIEITELPIRTWIQSYKEQLEQWAEGGDKVQSWIKDIRENYTDTTVKFLVTLTEENMKVAEAEGLEKRFKLSTQLSMSNMVCFDSLGKIKKYASPQEILEEFYTVRLSYYGKRKKWLEEQLQQATDQLSNKVRFILEVNDGKLIISRRKKSDILIELKKRGYKAFSSKTHNSTSGDNNEDEGDATAEGYNYLLNMSIWHLTYEKAEQLKKERDFKQKELDALRDKTVEEMYLEDLDDFEEEWKQLEEIYEIAQRENKKHEGKGKGKGKGRKGKTTAATIKAQKKMFGKPMKFTDDEDSDDYVGSSSSMQKAESSTSTPRNPRRARKIVNLKEDSSESEMDIEIEIPKTQLRSKPIESASVLSTSSIAKLIPNIDSPLPAVSETPKETETEQSPQASANTPEVIKLEDTSDDNSDTAIITPVRGKATTLKKPTSSGKSRVKRSSPVVSPQTPSKITRKGKEAKKETDDWDPDDYNKIDLRYVPDLESRPKTPKSTMPARKGWQKLVMELDDEDEDTSTSVGSTSTPTKVTTRRTLRSTRK